MEETQQQIQRRLRPCEWADTIVNFFNIMKMDLSYCIEEQSFYMYQDGYWNVTKDIKLEAKIIECFPEFEKLREHDIKATIMHIKRKLHRDLEGFNAFPLMNMVNGMVNPKDRSFEDHDPIYYSTIRIPYKYEPDAKCNLWLTSLHEILEGNTHKIDTIQEFFGYCLVPDVKHKKALILLGESDSGKSTILNVLRDILGHQNSSSIPLKSLSNAQYLPMIIGKLANIDPDVGRNASNYEEEFKLITSGEPVNCNQKYVEAFKFIPKARMVMAANTFPRISDPSNAFYTRLIIVPCERTFTEEEKDRELQYKLKNELPGILNWAIEGLQRLNKRGYFEQKDFSIEAIQELNHENNPPELFLIENVKMTHACEIPKTYLFAQYIAWCEEQGIRYRLTDIMFSKVVYKMFRQYTGKKMRSSYGTRPWVWNNLEYIGPERSIRKENHQESVAGWVE